MSYVTAALTAQNTFTAGAESVGSDRGQQDGSAIISGTFVATVTLQISLDGGVTWADLPTTYTAPAVVNIIPARGAMYRGGVKTGNFTSGTVDIEIRI